MPVPARAVGWDVCSVSVKTVPRSSVKFSSGSFCLVSSIKRIESNTIDLC